MERIVHNHKFHMYVTSKNCQNNYHKLCKFIESFGSGNSSLRIYYHWKIQNQCIFLKSWCKKQGRIEDFYICCFFLKHSGRPVISILKSLGQREEQNNAAALNLLKSDSLRVDDFFGSAFAVDLAGVTKLFFIILSETSFLHLISCVSTNSFYRFWPIFGIASMKAQTSSLYAISVPTLINEPSKNGLVESNLPIMVV